MLDPEGEWFQKNLKFSFEVDEENIETNAIESTKTCGEVFDKGYSCYQHNMETNAIESTKACEIVFNEDYSCYQHNMETNTIELIMKDFYGSDWSSPFHFEFNAEIEA